MLPPEGLRRRRRSLTIRSARCCAPARMTKLTDPRSRFGAGHQNITTVLQEVERLGIPRVL